MVSAFLFVWSVFEVTATSVRLLFGLLTVQAHDPQVHDLQVHDHNRGEETQGVLMCGKLFWDVL